MRVEDVITMLDGQDAIDAYHEASIRGQPMPPAYQAIVERRAECADHEAFAICLHMEQDSYQECWEATCRT